MKYAFVTTLVLGSFLTPAFAADHSTTTSAQSNSNIVQSQSDISNLLRVSDQTLAQVQGTRIPIDVLIAILAAANAHR